MVVLARKIYVEGEARERTLDSLTQLVTDALGDLEVEFDVGLRTDDFPSVTVQGDDEVVARNLLRKRWGEITPNFEAGETYTGTLSSWDSDGLTLDAGREIQIPASTLELGPGDPTQLKTRFGLVQHLPMEFVYEPTQSRLAESEADRLFAWQRGAGRVHVNSSTRAAVRATVNRAGHADDILTVERLGILEQSVVCAAGTDPPGLLAAIGPHLEAELACVVP